MPQVSHALLLLQVAVSVTAFVAPVGPGHDEQLYISMTPSVTAHRLTSKLNFRREDTASSSGSMLLVGAFAAAAVLRLWVKADRAPGFNWVLGQETPPLPGSTRGTPLEGLTTGLGSTCATKQKNTKKDGGSAGPLQKQGSRSVKVASSTGILLESSTTSTRDLILILIIHGSLQLRLVVLVCANYSEKTKHFKS